MPDPIVTLARRVVVAWRVAVSGRLAPERGEGVISAAIAVLVIASLGALMWVAFRAMWSDVELTTRDQMRQIGS